MTQSDLDQIKSVIEPAQHIVILQADNPDGDSLGSALALEEILGKLGKQTSLYCGIDMPTYLRYLEGWSRVSNEIPKQFDASIIVDASTKTLFQKLEDSGQMSWVASKPCIVLDHHAKVDHQIPFATVLLNNTDVSSTGELIYKLSKKIGWTVPTVAMEYMMTAILGDTQGLSNTLATADTYWVMAEFVEAGVDRPKLEEQRRLASKMQPEIFRYKGTLIGRTEFAADGSIAFITIPQQEITAYSPLYNPAPLIQNDMLQTQGVRVAIVLKRYGDGKITGAIRCNADGGIAGELAAFFGGGGHAYASGFKMTDGQPFDEVKQQILSKARELLQNQEPNA